MGKRESYKIYLVGDLHVPGVRMETEYVVMVEYKGYDRSLDRKLEKIAGRSANGSGAMLPGKGDCVRDLSWDYKLKRYADALVKKLRAAKLKSVTVKLLEV